jgi:tetratricopeptide (TPR) repeat protein
MTSEVLLQFTYMETSKRSEFSIKRTTEQEYFQVAPTRQFFAKWCEVNDSIEPKYVSRDEWNKKRDEGILQKKRNEDGKQSLFIPEDLKLWEMVDVIEAVDKDTFARNSAKRPDKRNEFYELGEDFINTAAYVAQGVDGIHEGKDTAMQTAKDLYSYGVRLQRARENVDDATVEEIASIDIRDKKEGLDKQFGVDKLAKLKKQNPEQTRQEMLAQFFKVAEIAGSRGGIRGRLDERFRKKKEAEGAPHRKALQKVYEKYLEKPMEKPERELYDAVFRRGLEKLVQEMGKDGWTDKVKTVLKKNQFDVERQQKNFMETLEIPVLKQELDALRNPPDGQKADLQKIGDKEREIADEIQWGVSSFPYKRGANKPSEMLVAQYINCVGASMLGGALMKEAGLSYLVGSAPEHSILFLVTSDGRVEWRDMQSRLFNEDLVDERIRGRNRDGSRLRVADIVSFSKSPSPEGLMFDIESEKYGKKLPWVKEGKRQYVVAFEPEYGQKIQILNSIGATLKGLGDKKMSSKERENYYGQALEAYSQAVVLSPNYAYARNGRGSALSGLGRQKEAIEEYSKAIAINAEYSTVYRNIGDSFSKLGDKEGSLKKREYYKQSLEAYIRGAALEPEYTSSYNRMGNVLVKLGFKNEAVEAYQMYIDLADKEKDGPKITRAKVIMAKLKRDIANN